MGSTWILSAPGGPHIGPMNLAIRDDITLAKFRFKCTTHWISVYPSSYQPDLMKSTQFCLKCLKITTNNREAQLYPSVNMYPPIRIPRRPKKTVHLCIAKYQVSHEKGVHEIQVRKSIYRVRQEHVCVLHVVDFFGIIFVVQMHLSCSISKHISTKCTFE